MADLNFVDDIDEIAKKKNLLIYANYYIPDVASTGQILKELAEGIKESFDITVICVVPSYTGKISNEYKTQKYYKEEINGVKLLRIRVPEFSKDNKISRIKNIISYFWGSIKATFKVGKMDYVYAISQPPILGGLLGVWGKWIKHAKFIYNVQDFNPEQTVAVGYSNNKFILSLMLKLDKFSCRQANKVIVVGRDMLGTLEERFVSQGRGHMGKMPKSVFINNWIDEKEIYPLNMTNPKVQAFRKKYGLDGKLVIMYSGNIGLYYDLENLFRVIEKFRNNKDVIFAFVGDGTVKGQLVEYKEEHRMDNVVFIPYQKKEDLIYSLNAGDIHWCVNAKGIKGISVPSKLYGIMAVGKPVLGVMEAGAEARLIVEETGCGLMCEPGDYEKVERNINWFIENSQSPILQQMSRNGRWYLEKRLTKNVSIEKYVKEILNS